MENVLNWIHGKFIKLPEGEVRRNKKILEDVISTLTDKLKEINPLFNSSFRRKFYGGSTYDGLRIRKPTEFDLDFLLKIPKKMTPRIIESDIPGFIFLEVIGNEENEDIKSFKKCFINGGFLDTQKVRQWMESIVQKALNNFDFRDNNFIIPSEWNNYSVKFYKAGPALTLVINDEIDVDLVPCFVFGNEYWPVTHIKSNPCPSIYPEFFIVPKEPKTQYFLEAKQSHYWRLSFQEQERHLIKSKEKLKSAIRLIKQIKELQHPNIASYYIKTVFLHMLYNCDQSIWNQPLYVVFMAALKEYTECMRNESIPYYWDPRNNLIDGINSANLQNICGRLTTMIRKIEQNVGNPAVIARYLLDDKDYNTFMDEFCHPESSIEVETENSKCIIL